MGLRGRHRWIHQGPIRGPSSTNPALLLGRTRLLGWPPDQLPALMDKTPAARAKAVQAHGRPLLLGGRGRERGRGTLEALQYDFDHS